MTFDWNAHRFSGGVLALDLANTVIYRETPERSLDRFADPDELSRFAAAASHFRKGEWGNALFRSPLLPRERAALISVRESINELFRSAASGSGLKPAHLSEFLRLASELVCDEPAEQDIELPEPHEKRRELSLGAAAVLSALRLCEPARLKRIKICPNCHWLFLDESRNSSRRWCDMSVCGNRAKAKRHYRRKTMDD
jgi:predicted RNA-binding Zn ribbon-like protein